MILGTIGAIAGIGSTIYGAVKQSQAAKKEEALMAEQKAANEAWYNRNYYQDYLNTVGAQNAIKRYRDLLAEQTKEARARQVITGGTPEQAQAVAEAGAEGYSNLVGNLAAQGEAQKQAVDAQKLAMDANLNAQGLTMAQKQQQAGANLVANGINTLASSLQSIELPQKSVESSGGNNGVETPTGTSSTRVNSPDIVGKEAGINPDLIVPDANYYSKNKKYYEDAYKTYTAPYRTKGGVF